MSTATEVNSGSNFLHTRYDRSKIFLGENRYLNSQTVLNAGGSTATFAAGTLLGRVTASGKLVPLASGSTDGSETPVGILAQDVTLAASGETQASVCVAGNVLKSKVVLDGSDTMATTIGGRTIADLIGAETVGIMLLDADELSATDNDL